MTLGKRRSEYPVTIYPGTAIGNGSKNVASAATAVQLTTTSTPCKRVIIVGKAANTNKIYIGGSTVSSTSGMYIYASQPTVIEIDDLNKIYIDADTNGEGVQYTFVS